MVKRQAETLSWYDTVVPVRHEFWGWVGIGGVPARVTKLQWTALPLAGTVLRLLSVVQPRGIRVVHTVHAYHSNSKEGVHVILETKPEYFELHLHTIYKHKHKISQHASTRTVVSA